MNDDRLPVRSLEAAIDTRGGRGAARALGAAAVVIALVLLCGGCVGMTGPRSLARSIEEQHGVTLQPVVALDIGGLLASAALQVASHESGFDLTRGRIDWVEVGVYEIADGAATPRPAHLLDAIEIEGWTACVKVRDGGDEVRIFIEHDDATISGLATLVHDGDEMVIVRIRGDLAPLAEEAIRLALEHEEFRRGREELMKHARQEPGEAGAHG